MMSHIPGTVTSNTLELLQYPLRHPARRQVLRSVIRRRSGPRTRKGGVPADAAQFASLISQASCRGARSAADEGVAYRAIAIWAGFSARVRPPSRAVTIGAFSCWTLLRVISATQWFFSD